MRIRIILLNVLLLIFLFVLIYLYIYVNYNNITEKFVGEGAIFLQSVNNKNSNLADVSTVTTNANNTTTESIELGEQIPINEEYMGMDPKNAFVNIIDIMCQNRIIKLKGATNGIYFNNGYYWINIPIVGPKLLFLITNDEIQSGGWLLAMRATKESETYNIISYSNLLDWFTDTTTKKSYSNYILSLEINSKIRHNKELGLLKYNNDLVDNFNISSIGNKIYTSNSLYDCKYEIFNNYNIKEIMVIFYKDSIDDSLNKKIAYLKIPNKELDNVSTLNNLFAKAIKSVNVTYFNTFKTNKNMDLLYNFSIDIYNIQGGSTTTSTSKTSSLSTHTAPIESFLCLLGVQGTVEARVENGVNIPRTRYIYGVGVRNLKNTIRSSALLIEIPDIINTADDIKYFPLGFELYIK